MANSIKDRLSNVMTLFPFPALISFFIVGLFLAHLIPSLNPRFGSPAQLIEHSTTPEPTGSIWISAYPDEDNNLKIKTIDRQTFFWPLDNPSQNDIEPFLKYLKKKVEDIQVTQAVEGRVNYIKTSAIISCDVKLNYYHMKPILYALAAANIGKYGFETKMGTDIATQENSKSLKEL